MIEEGSYPDFETPEGPRVTIAGTGYDWFRGNGYLGLYGHPEVLRAAAEATLRYGMKLRAKRPEGCHPCLLELEQRAMELFATGPIAYFSTGYAANAGLVAALGDRYDLAFVDGEAHYAVVDAVAAGGKPVHRFAHLDAEDLGRHLRRHLRHGQRPLAMSDGLFPISGEIAPAPDYWRVLQAYDGALLCLDDAHAVGVLGARGRGVLEHYEIEGPGRHTAWTLSKALGAYGGMIAGSPELIARVQARSGVYRGSALPPPGVVAAAAKALALVAAQPGIRRRLAANVAAVRGGLSALGLAVDAGSPSPIVCLDRRNKLDLEAVGEAFFRDRRIALLYTEGGYPSTPAGGALVFTLFATHSDEQLGRLLAAFREVL